jgi:hypothetical protein
LQQKRRTIGQADAGLLAGGGYTLAGGFWAGVPARYGIYLPPVLRQELYPVAQLRRSCATTAYHVIAIALPKSEHGVSPGNGYDAVTLRGGV